jgi:hypothetical protein
VALCEEDGNIVDVFLPRIYRDNFEVADLAAIHTRQLKYYITYNGKVESPTH